MAAVNMDPALMFRTRWAPVTLPSVFQAGLLKSLRSFKWPFTAAWSTLTLPHAASAEGFCTLLKWTFLLNSCVCHSLSAFIVPGVILVSLDLWCASPRYPRSVFLKYVFLSSHWLSPPISLVHPLPHAPLFMALPYRKKKWRSLGWVWRTLTSGPRRVTLFSFWLPADCPSLFFLHLRMLPSWALETSLLLSRVID